MSAAHAIGDAAPPRFDPTRYKQALHHAGLAADWPYALTLAGGTIHACDPQTASLDGQPVWTLINEPMPGFPPRKPRNEDIAVVRNVHFEGELPEDPARCRAFAADLRAELERGGIIPPGSAWHDSGAGFHAPIPIVPLATADHGGGDVINDAVKAVIDRYIRPVFDAVAEAHGLAGKVRLEATDIGRILSFPGTYRPRNPRKPDAPDLHGGYLRGWLPPHDLVPPERIESAILSTLIATEARAIRAARLRPSAAPVAAAEVPLATGSEREAWIRERATRHPVEDRSSAFHSLVTATYMKFGEGAARSHAELIDSLTGGKYGRRAGQEVGRSLRKAPPREERHMGVVPEVAELAAVQSERDALRATCTELRGRFAEAEAKVDRLALDGSARTIADLQRQLEEYRTRESQVKEALDHTELTWRERVAGTRLLYTTGAFRRRAAFGKEELPPREERRLAVGAFAHLTGIPKDECGKVIKAIAAAGIVARREVTVGTESPDGRTAYRTEIYISPGSGMPDADTLERLRREKARKGQTVRDAKAAKEAGMRAAEAERGAALARAQAGCIHCGDALLPTGYCCMRCLIEFTTKEVAAAPHPQNSKGCPTGGGEDASSAIPDASPPEKPGGIENTNRSGFSGGCPPPSQPEEGDFYNTYHGADWWRNRTARAGPAPPAASGRLDLIAEEDF